VRTLTILIYHRVLPAPDPLFPDVRDASGFADQVRAAARIFDVLPLCEAVERLRDGTLPHLAAAITFDDGYADNAEVAMPVLHRLGVPATFFVATGFLNGGCMWNDRVIEAVRQAPGPTLDLNDLGLGTHEVATIELRRRAIDVLLERIKYFPMEERQKTVDALASLLGASMPQLMMTDDQVRALHRGGMEIGGHTAFHPILTVLDPARAREEIVGGKRALERIVGQPIRVFAYPNGRPQRDYAGAHVDMVREAGFEFAVSTATGVATRGSDRYQLPRFAPWPRSRWRLGIELLRNLARTRYDLA